MTNEQAVITAGREIARLKSIYVQHVTPLVISYQQSNIQPSLEALLKSQQLGNDYFNYVESFVGESGLLGAHANGKWVTGFAEDCAEILKSYVLHAQFINSWESVLGPQSKPSINAFSNMQRMAAEYLPKQQVASLKELFESNSLPVQGFYVKAASNEEKQPKWQIITSIVIGCISLIAIVTIALLLPNPTEFQEFIFRGLLALALASIASLVPGFMNLKIGTRSSKAYFAIYAGGAIAIFVLIWLVNPPKIGTPEANSIPPAIEQHS